MRVTGLYLYPVKSLRGCAVSTLELDALGGCGDRRFLVVDAGGRFLTQRTLPRMALIGTALGPDTLQLTAAGAGTVTVPRAPDPAAPLRTVSVWQSEGLQAEDCGDAAAVWLSGFLGLACRLVRIGPAFHRPVRKLSEVLRAWGRPPPLVAFADAFPFLLASEASLADLNDRLAVCGEEPVPWDRFRPNLVIAGCPAHAEDTWPRLRIGAVTFRAAGPCARCVVTTTDQQTAARGPEPLRTLASYRRDSSDSTLVNFGQNLIHEGAGVLHVGDPVLPL